MLAELTTVTDVALAQILRGRLAAAGIEAVLFDEGFSGLLGGGFPGIRLMVIADDLPAARGLLGLPENEASD
ncbi:putative signal transducing protein [Sandaracinobacteroides hominis]|uniref:putative signal transducing protein n=1 Tax=Sandaracinobacteroides hominis TaxID=2780086 RepID=UPI0018F5BC77|nr:DUF2007 domain-containing protein [Sandaracinobacteroides hominis]